jgi:hypothetical protein
VGAISLHILLGDNCFEVRGQQKREKMRPVLYADWPNASMSQ